MLALTDQFVLMVANLNADQRRIFSHIVATGGYRSRKKAIRKIIRPHTVYAITMMFCEIAAGAKSGRGAYLAPRHRGAPSDKRLKVLANKLAGIWLARLGKKYAKRGGSGQLVDFYEKLLPFIEMKVVVTRHYRRVPCAVTEDGRARDEVIETINLKERRVRIVAALKAGLGDAR